MEGLKRIFVVKWARLFVEEVTDLTQNGRKLLLLYDGYRSHMSHEALKVLDDGNLIAFGLPAHTSSTTQPLDVGVFGPFKANIDRFLHEMCSTIEHNVLDAFDFCKIIREAYWFSFTIRNITPAFSKCGLCPSDLGTVLGASRPFPEHFPSVLIDADEMEIMLEKRRAKRSGTQGVMPVVFKGGFVDTKAGLQLTSPDVMRAILSKEGREREKADAKYLRNQ